MAVAVANTNQYLYKRNFNENKWAAVGEAVCRVQVTEKSGEFYFRINDGVEKKEFHLSQDSRLHLSKGFVQVPIAENRALYGIKFNKPEEAETFYGKVVRKMGQGWCDQRTGMDADNLPKPYSMFDMGSGKHAPPPSAVSHVEVPQSLPASRMRQSAQFNPSQSGREINPSQSGREINPSQSGREINPSHPGRNFVPPVMARNDPQQKVLRAGASEVGGGAYVQGGGDGRDVSNMSRYDMGYQGDTGQGRGDPSPYGVGHGGHPGGRYEENRYVGSRGFAVGPDNRGFGGGPSGGFAEGPTADYPRRAGAYNEYNGGGRGNPMYAGGAGQQMDRGRNFHGGEAPHGGVYGGGHPPQRPPGPRIAWEANEHPSPVQNARPPQPQVARPAHIKPADLPSVVKSLSNAINKGSKKEAVALLEAFFSVETKRGKVSMQLEDATAASVEENKFVLHIRVEFQQPEKKPLVIFLDDIQEADTVDDLKTMVQVKFFIPKASQNWIIGKHLVTSNDLQKSLKDLGVSGEVISEVKVFMYVMHPKKANVPKEEFEGIRARQMQQKKQQQGQAAPEFFGQASIPGQGNFSRPGGGYPTSAQPDQGGGPIYNTLGDRGYIGDHPYASDQPPQRAIDHHQQYSHIPADQTYSQISMQGDGPRGKGDLVTRAPPPNAGRVGTENMPVYSRVPASSQLPQTMPPPHPSRQRNPLAVQVLPTMVYPPSMSAAPPPQSLKLVGWSCAACTMFNPPHRPSCEVCLADRPQDYVVPEDAPLDEATRKAMESEKDFEEYQRLEKLRETMEARENYRQYLDTDAGEAVANTKEFECQICFTLTPPGDGLVLRGCLHEFCKECLRGSVVNSNEPEIKCPFDNGEYVCGAVISEREIKAVVSEEELVALYQRGLREAENAAPNSFHCRTANCDNFCFYEDEVNEFNCPVCGKKNCILCKAIHEGMNCQEYQDDLKRRAANDEAAMETQKMLEDLVEKGEAMNCPQCKIIVQKKDGCDWIRCVMCKTEICWATKQRRWGPKGKGDIEGGCRCRVGGKKCHPLCKNCH